MGTPRETGLLFVCMGNICRSPLAEGVFIHMARSSGQLQRFRIDSCGTGGWHVGRPPDSRSVQVAKKHGIELVSTARQLAVPEDFERFEYLIAMDRDNRDHMLGAGAPADRVHLMRSFDPAMRGMRERDLDVPDPYYGPGDGFQRIYEMIHAACEGLLEQLARPSE